MVFWSTSEYQNEDSQGQTARRGQGRQEGDQQAEEEGHEEQDDEEDDADHCRRWHKGWQLKNIGKQRSAKHPFNL